MPAASRKVIVSVEEIVDTETLRKRPEKTILPGFMVDALVEVPFGAHPTSFYPDYGYDSRFHREWAAISRDDAAVSELMDRCIIKPENQQQYLDAVGGEEIISRIQQWDESP